MGAYATKYVEIKLKTGELERQMNSLKTKIDAQANGFEKMFESGAKMVGGLVAAYETLHAAIEFGVDAVKEYIDYAQGFAKVEAIIKSTGGAAGFTAKELEKIAERLAEVNGVDAGKILNGITANLLTFKNIAGGVFERTQQAIFDMTATMNGDFVGATIRLGKALNDPVQGMMALSIVGVQFGPIQKQLIKDLIAHNDLLGAQKVILKEVESEYHGTSEAANKATGGMRNLGVAFTEFKESVGKTILEAITPFVEGFTKIFKSLTPTKTLMEETRENTEKLADRFEFLSGTALRLGKNTNNTKEEQKLYTDSVKALITEYPNYFKGLDANATKFDTIKSAISDAKISLDKYIESMIQQALIQDKMDKLIENARKRQAAYEGQNKTVAEIIKRTKDGTMDEDISPNLNLGRTLEDGSTTTGAGITWRKYLADQKNAFQDIIDTTKNEDEEYTRLTKDLANQHKIANGVDPNPKKKTKLSGDFKNEYQEKFDAELEAFKIHTSQMNDLREKDKNSAIIKTVEEIDKYDKALGKKELSQTDHDALVKSRQAALTIELARIDADYDYKKSLESLDNEETIAQQALEVDKATDVEKLEQHKKYLEKKLALQQAYDAKYHLDTNGNVLPSDDTKTTGKDITATGNKITVSSNKAQEDAQAAYYDKMKFLDSSYYDWKKGKIEEEYELSIKNGLAKVEAEKFQKQSLLELDKERLAFIADSAIGLQAMQNTFEGVFGNIADAMVGKFDLASMKIKDIMNNLVDDVLKSLARIAAEKMVMAILNVASGGLGSIGSFIGGLFGGSGPGGKSFSGSGDSGLVTKIGGSGIDMPSISSSNNNNGNAQIVASIQALTRTVMEQQTSTNVNNSIVLDGRQIATSVIQHTNDMRRNGVITDVN